MKRNQSSRRPRQRTRLWTYMEAVRAMPYIDSILRSLRDALLASRSFRARAERLKNQPGPRTRADLIALTELEEAAERAYGRYLECIDELQAMNVPCPDPIQGEVLFPFIYDRQIAWFTHNLFDGPRLLWWRYDNDSPETRRPIYADMRYPNQELII